MEIDLFESHWSAQLDRFMSWKPQPEARGVNTFNITWDNLRGYAFPPIYANSEMFSENQEGESRQHIDCPNLAESNLVPDHLGDGGRQDTGDEPESVVLFGSIDSIDLHGLKSFFISCNLNCTSVATRPRAYFQWCHSMIA